MSDIETAARAWADAYDAWHEQQEAMERGDKRRGKETTALLGALATANGKLRDAVERSNRALAGGGEGEDRSCPCFWTTPCSAQCNCLKPWSSRSCTRCCKVGSEDQRRERAVKLAELIDRRSEVGEVVSRTVTALAHGTGVDAREIAVVLDLPVWWIGCQVSLIRSTKNAGGE